MTAVASESGCYLVQFGKSGFVGRFRFDDELPLERGDRVIVQGPRGMEFGTVLCEPATRFQQQAPEDGAILRRATSDDEFAADHNAQIASDLLAAAEAAGLPIAFVDVEVSLDASAAILHAIPWDACDADPLLAALSERFALPVRMFDLSRTPVAKDETPAAGCGKPGCGSESGGCTSCSTGGCSTGSCSKGKVKSASELTAYFADLRQQMETRTPLN